MKRATILEIWLAGAFVLILSLPIVAIAQDPPSECVEMGALAFDDWTKADAGGIGMPDGETDADYTRCKACHGWDQRGTDGGYVKRSRKDGRPNAGFGDIDKTSRNIAFTDRGGALITADMIFHTGTGRALADGSGSWVPLDAEPSPANKAAHAAGYTLGNQHPDFSTGGANALTQQQADCLAEFLNFPDAGWDAYFDAINPNASPVLYTIRADADATRGETFYTSVCFACHGDPSEVGTPFSIEGEGVLSFLADTPHFSEFYNKVRWGHPDSPMTRGAMGDPTALLVADLMLYLQELGGTGFAITAGISGTWVGTVGERDGEGWLFDAGNLFVGALYTQNPTGDQAWLIGTGVPVGNTVVLSLIVADGPSFGDMRTQAEMNEEVWGTATLIFTSCAMGSATLTPNATMLGNGYVAYTTDISPLLGMAHSCP
jgi:cytochrome c553